MKIVTAPDVIEGSPIIILFDLNNDLQNVLLSELLSILPDDAVIAVGNDQDWAGSFANAVIVTDKGHEFATLKVDESNWTKTIYTFLKELNTNGHEQ